MKVLNLDGDLSLKFIEKNDLEFILEVRNSDSTRFFLENSNKFSKNDCLNWYQEKKPNWYIIYQNENRCGYVRLDKDDKKSICIGCDIHENYRNKGIAKKVYSFLINYFKNNDYDFLWLWVFEDNIIAYNLYKKLGFEDVDFKFLNNRKYIKMEKKLK